MLDGAGHDGDGDEVQYDDEDEESCPLHLHNPTHTQGEGGGGCVCLMGDVLRVKYTVGILFNMSISPSPFICSNLLSLFPYYIQTPISCYLSVCFNTLRYVSTYLLNLVVVPLTLSSVLPLGTLQYT